MILESGGEQGMPAGRLSDPMDDGGILPTILPITLKRNWQGWSSDINSPFAVLNLKPNGPKCGMCMA